VFFYHFIILESDFQKNKSSPTSFYDMFLDAGNYLQITKEYNFLEI